MPRCRRCGFRSSDASFFRRQAAPEETRLQTVCEVCAPGPRTSPDHAAWSALLPWGLLAAFGTGWALSAGQVVGAFAIGAFAIAAVASWPALMALHEAGHAGVALLLGRPVRVVRLGSGPLLCVWRIGGARLELRGKIGSGSTEVAEWPTDAPVRNGLVTLGGPAANVFGVFAAFALAVEIGRSATGAAAVGAASLLGVGFSSALILLVTLWPWGFGLNDGRSGLSRRRPRPASEPETDQLALASATSWLGYHDEAVRRVLEVVATRPEDPAVVSLAIHCLSRRDGDAAAIAWWEGQALDAARLAAPSDHEQMPWLRANIAWSALKAGRMDLADLIEQGSASALAAAPDRPEMQATRGAWLIESGHLDQGAPMLLAATRQTDDRLDKADFCRFLSRAAAAQGDAARAAAFAAVERRFRDWWEPPG